MAEDLLKEGKEAILLYANRTRHGIVFARELKELSLKFQSFKIIHILTEDPAWEGEIGRINQEKIKRFAPDVTERDIFICGPPPMMMGIIALLSAMGVSRTQIHYELFSL